MRCVDCLRDATHGLTKTPRQGWAITKRGRVTWCRRHASCEAICRNAGHAHWTASDLETKRVWLAENTTPERSTS